MMKTYVIGDLQGCAHEAGLLLERIAADAHSMEEARVLFVGDLINRGPESLTALRRMKTLSETSGGRVEALLGIHDLHLLAVAAGVQKTSRSDTLDEILAAPDRDELLGLIEEHRIGQVPLIVPMTLMKHHVRRLDVEYLLGQTYLDPHPRELSLRNHV